MSNMTACGACATDVQVNAKFCHECGTPVAAQAPAEFKQVTVLFADVVRSMDLAAEVGAERLREIMTELVDLAVTAVRRYGGTVDKFTGDGVMAVFGAPTTLEDHAFRACLAAIDIQAGTGLQLRIGLNSGQVVAGDIGSGALGYTAIGEQVGMAQRMESVAQPGGVMLSESTARLVDGRVVLGEPETVRIKGSDAPVTAKRLIGVDAHGTGPRTESALVGRGWELDTVTAILDEAVGGAGCVVTLAGPPGIGKSRLVREASAIATRRGVPVFATYCESHASDVPFRAVAQLLRVTLGIDGVDPDAASFEIRERFHDANSEDLLLLEDLLGVRSASGALPDIAPDARRRRLAALINTASLARAEPAVYVIEDVHWIDEPSESMLVEFLAVVPQTPSLTLITYRPEYSGPLSRVAGAQNLALRPLSDAHSATLTAELLGSHPSIAELAAVVRHRAAGNPFFAEEIVRDLTERGVIDGQLGAYALRTNLVDANVPATLSATIGARIDRLDAAAKETLNAAAVIGLRFDQELLSQLVERSDLASLINAELIIQVAYHPRAEYAFRHPLIRAVAYESQLKSARAQRHRALAAALESRGSVDENAALIAEHIEAAGDLPCAYEWHMRAGEWSTHRNVDAARTSWSRAQRVADLLPDDHPNRMPMRIAPRTFLAGTAWRIRGGLGDPHFEELRELCTAVGDRHSLAIGLAGSVTHHIMNARRQEASRLAGELVDLIDSIGDPALDYGLSIAPIAAKHECGEVVEMLRLSQRVIDLSSTNPDTGNVVFESPLTFAFASRGTARCSLGIPGWRADLDNAARMLASTVDPMALASVTWWVFGTVTSYGIRIPDEAALRVTAENLAIAERSGDDYALDTARLTRGVTLLHTDRPDRDVGLELLEAIRSKARSEVLTWTTGPIAEIHIARELTRRGNLDAAIDLARNVSTELLGTGGCIWTSLAVEVLVDAMVDRGSRPDIEEAHIVVDRLSEVPTDAGFVLSKVTLARARALLAGARDDRDAYRRLAASYRQIVTDLGFEGHMAKAATLPTNQ